MSEFNVVRRAVLSAGDAQFVLSNREEVDTRVESWLINVAGWFGGVGVSDPTAQRTLGHGFFPAPSLRTGRELTLEGVLVFQTERDRSVADRFVSGLLWDGGYGTLDVTTDDLTLTSYVKLGGEIKHQYMGVNAMRVQVPLTASDPFLYAPERLYQIFPAGFGEGLAFPLFSASGTGALDWGASAPFSGAFANAGNATAYPTFTVHGSWPSGFSITEGARSLTYPEPVTATSPITIDTRTGTVTEAGMDRTYLLTKRDWVDVPAGEAIQPRITALAPSTGWCDVTISDTFV